jgi:hypothetical protein
MKLWRSLILFCGEGFRLHLCVPKCDENDEENDFWGFAGCGGGFPGESTGEARGFGERELFRDVPAEGFEGFRDEIWYGVEVRHGFGGYV